MIKLLFLLNIIFAQFNIDDFNEKLDEIKSEKNIVKKVLTISENMLGIPFKHNPIDKNNEKLEHTFDGVDCVTFVETVLALAIEPDVEKSLDILKKIRYNNKQPSYANRNHFMISQWIPYNIKNGYLEEITHKLVKDKNLTSDKKVLSVDSFGDKFQSFLKIKENIPFGEYDYKYIEINYFINNFYKIKVPEGSIMAIVRENLDNYPIIISHIGFIAYKNKIPYFRSAVVSTKFKEVKDFKLIPYLSFYKKFYAESEWPIIGVQFYLPKK